jgi:hypothetical protein
MATQSHNPETNIQIQNQGETKIFNNNIDVKQTSEEVPGASPKLSGDADSRW